MIWEWLGARVLSKKMRANYFKAVEQPRDSMVAVEFHFLLLAGGDRDGEDIKRGRGEDL